jgi:uncharacterized protein (TIGR02001 family)
VRAALLLCLAALLSDAGVSLAQVAGHVELLSDYRFRGESLTSGRPALQAGVSYDHPSGLFAGALASNVRIDPEVSGLGGQIYAGYARPFTARASWDVGLVTYLFPNPARELGYDYTEAFIGLSYDRLNARLYYTDEYFGGGRAVYCELNGSRALGQRFVLIGHFGYLGHREPRQPSTEADGRSLVDFKAGIGLDLSGFMLELSVVGTAGPQSACPAGTGHCDTGAVVSIAHQF